ncbi:MAG: (Fe-S)-binding protein [Bacteroidia bacterium]|nr:(Fe-S)-binding protein [Bacteroidia bacterium]
MAWFAQLLFAAVFVTAVVLFSRSVGRIRRNLQLGRHEPRTDNRAQRWRNVLLVALGQKKMFARPLPAVLHLCVYVGFLVVNVEVIEIVVDGLAGTHRFFGQFGGVVYDAVIAAAEVFLVLVLLGTLGFLARRDLLKLKRFTGTEMTRWPRMDARIILVTEIVLVAALVVMNAADQTLQARGAPHYVQAGVFPFSGVVAPLFAGMGTGTLVAVERTAWWLHIVGILAFLNYIPYSKHLHILLAFPNTYYSNTGIKPLGGFAIDANVKREVELMLTGDPYAAPATDAPATPQRFGAKDVFDLPRADLLAAYTCTECGRCTSVCPQNQTGKLLSPRKIMMDTRDRAEEVGVALAKTNGQWQDDGKSLLGSYITPEEVWACNTCSACADACPVNINPMGIIVQLRQYQVMEESGGPMQLNSMFNNITNAGTPWALSAADRFNWADQVEVPDTKLTR